MDFALKILIVEDEFSFALELEMLVEEIGYQVIGKVDNSAEALDLIFSSSPDLILMDIDIKGNLTGLEIGERIKHLNIPILFITSFGDEAHYQAAHQSNMIGYLVKPIEKYSLKSTINLAIKNAFAQIGKGSKEENPSDNFIFKNFLFLKKRNAYAKINIDQILYIESDDKYCISHLKNGESFVSRITISNVESQLPQKYFIRVHRKYIVSLQWIDTIAHNFSGLQIKDQQIPIGRTYKEDLSKRMKRFD